MTRKRRNHQPTVRFEIWQTPAGINSIDNPVRLQILARLLEGPRTLSELVRDTRRAKSTLSAVHLPPLLRVGLIEEAPHVKDARVKTYRIRGERLGSSDVDRERLRDAVLRYAQSAAALRPSLLLELVDLPKLAQSGANPQYQRALAHRLGTMLAETFRPEEGSVSAASSLDRLFQGARVGRVRHENAERPEALADDPRLQSLLEEVLRAAFPLRAPDEGRVDAAP